MRYHRCWRLSSIMLAVTTIIFLVSSIILAVLLGIQKNKQTEVPTTEHRLKWPKPSPSSYSRYKRAAVASDNGFCSEIGRDILMLGGNAVDATVASLICIGVVNPQSSGLGGGFIMTIYNNTSHRCLTINARETAPATANETMFDDSPQDAAIDILSKLIKISGFRSIATPSELHGLWTVFSRFGSGKVSWNRLFQPSIELALKGFPITASLAQDLKKLEKTILEEPSLKKVFVNSETGKIYEEGDIITRDHLGATLQFIANSTDPIELFYRGGVAQTIASEFDEHGGFVSADDLSNYRTVINEEPLITEEFIEDLVICGPPPPSSSAVTQSIIAVMAEFYRDISGTVFDRDDPLIYHRFIEAQKFGYAQRMKLGDTDFVPEALQLALNLTKNSYAKQIKSLITDKAQPLDKYITEIVQQLDDHGTSHISAIDQEGNAVSCTSTINRIFGAKRISPTLGIVWNNEMDDFSLPGRSNSFGYAPSPANYIKPGKRPLSSMSPLIIYNKHTKKVKMVVGASGGSYIISTVAQAVIHTLLFNKTVKEAVDEPRFHNQFLPPETLYETTIPQEIIENLVNVREQNVTATEKVQSVIQALVISNDGYIYGNSDFRRETASHPAGF
ncbi:unnamed protein product [Thelazia callipaeda]|uniref:Gamma-glutamyltranspeptidase 1 n=1 Tax=Thelazia callipaeda TaxID=103827 RepID=A0A0N5CLL5_THECL|nr:unnamed protein product [Thelazia callipaeda]